ncbi:Bacterio-opsin activator HTH domain protein [Halorubrum aidingense JCM 13560]|uniref:Bacterio-opsin activator HTH domain protein n=1 Tax=Halorubrum aidingense JCM 13560 TaxID=1230454 RepID=M0PFK3_9EURY|nr:helix-turn-helix domain-containing protein [Halorubrum aidingense]EMA68673.1 Bacterio-opsin activator HTH domain protein [Halorubrum aidingense JCM 13560]
MSNGIHVELTVSACDGCPVAALSSSTPVEELRVDSDDDRVEFVAADPPSDPPDGLDLVEFAGRAHGRYDVACERPATDGGLAVNPSAGPVSDGADAAAPGTVEAGAGTAGAGASTADDARGVCRGCSCGGLPAAFANFPVSPRRTEMEDGEIRVSFVLTGHEELSAIVDECEAAGLDVGLRRLCVDRGDESDDDRRPDVVPVDLSGVTDRQAEVAAVAAQKGYFNADGASAAEIAAELDLAKSTVSEHLRIVTDTLFSQLFGDGDRI